MIGWDIGTYIYIYIYIYMCVCVCVYVTIINLNNFWILFKLFIIKMKCVEKRKISYFGLALNLFQHLISPNQDDLSYSARTFIPACKTGERPNPVSLAWDDNQNRRPIGRPCLAMLFNIATPATWTLNEGTYLFYGFPTRNPSWT